MVRRLLAVLVLPVIFACGGDGSPTSPGGSSIPFFVVFTPLSGTTFSATLNGQTYSASGLFTVSLPPGAHEISGSFSASQFGITLGSTSPQLAGGGVQSGSLQSLAGSVFVANPCRIIYNSESNNQGNFRVRFAVVANPNAACQ